MNAPLAATRRRTPRPSPAPPRAPALLWISARPCAAGCGVPRADAAPTTPDALASLCARCRNLGRAAVRARRATLYTVVAYVAAVRARPRPPTEVGQGSTAPTVRETILLALASLGVGPVSTSALVLATWARDPARFGLRGCETEHPDSNRVLAKLSGAGGLPALGWCRRPAPSTVQLTAKGRRAAAVRARKYAAPKGGAR